MTKYYRRPIFGTTLRPAWRDSIERRRRAEARLHLAFVAGAVIIILILLYAFLYTLCAGV